MKLYSIAGWEKFFENSRSRSVERLHWVPIPNRHDGENYRMIISQKNGAELYGAWVLIIQVAAKCNPRGTLVKGNGDAHTPESIGLKTGASSKSIAAALDFIESNTDWLEIQHVTNKVTPAYHPSDIQLSLDCHPTDARVCIEENRIEQKRTEENGIELNRISTAIADISIIGGDVLNVPVGVKLSLRDEKHAGGPAPLNGEASGKRFKPPTREELNLAAAKIGLPDIEVDMFEGYYGSNGWMVGKNKMQSWRHSLAGWAARWKQKATNHAGHSGGHSGGTSSNPRNKYNHQPSTDPNYDPNAHLGPPPHPLD